MGIKLVATHEPAVSTRDLAIHLAEALQNVVNAEMDANEFLSQMQIENQKVVQLQFTLQQVKQYRKNPPENPSRMDPMLEYDLDAIEAEIAECKDRLNRWTKIREDSLQRARDLKAESVRIQKELADRKKRGI